MRKRTQKPRPTASSADQAVGRIGVAYRATSELKLNARNPRLHSQRQIPPDRVPILVNRDLQVIAGHGRVLAARQLGLERVPTIRLEHLSAEQAKGFAIADNRLTENSVWDERLLGEQLKELSLLNLDFSLEATGFTRRRGCRSG